jgi:hypothetical protein
LATDHDLLAWHRCPLHQWSFTIACALAIGCTDVDKTDYGVSPVPSDVIERRWYVSWHDTTAQGTGVGSEALSVGAVLVSGSTVVTGSYSTATLVAIDTDVDKVYELGRPGDGPGEFRALHRVRRCGEAEVVAQDFANGRVTFVTPRLELRAIIAVPPRVLGGELVACASDRTLQFVNDPPEVRGDGVYTVDQKVYAVRTSDGSVSLQGTWSITQMVFDTRLGVFFPLPLGNRALAAGAGDALHVVDAATCSVTVYRNHDIPLKRRVVHHVLARPVALARARARIADAMADSITRRKVRMAMERAPSGRAQPCAEQAVGIADGGFWLRLASSDVDTAATWLLIDRELRPEFRLTLPSTMEVMDSRGDAVLVLDRATDDGHLRLLRTCMAGDGSCL